MRRREDSADAHCAGSALRAHQAVFHLALRLLQVVQRVALVALEVREEHLASAGVASLRAPAWAPTQRLRAFSATLREFFRSMASYTTAVAPPETVAMDEGRRGERGGGALPESMRVKAVLHNCRGRTVQLSVDVEAAVERQVHVAATPAYQLVWGRHCA